jgi:Ca-activated chloride channel family protein
MRLRIEGDYRGAKKTMDVEFDPAAASTKNSFVPRLWASRRIGYLIDEIRQAAGTSAGSHEPPKELVKEIVELSTRWGILTEYTAFLATEPGAPATAAAPMGGAGAHVEFRIMERAAKSRDGVGAVNQSVNLKEAKSQLCASPSNVYLDDHMVRRQISTVQQVADQTLFCRGNRWIDGRIMQQKDGESAKPDKTIEFGSSEHFALACRLADEGGNRSALLAMNAEVMLLVDNQRVLVTAPKQENVATP